VLPLIILAVVAVPLLVLAFRAARRSRAGGEHPLPEDAPTRARTEREFAEAEAYEEKWREEEQQHRRESGR